MGANSFRLTLLAVAAGLLLAAPLAFKTDSVAPFGVAVAQTAARTITSLGPNKVTVGDPSFTLLVNGTGFANGDTVLLSGSPLETTFVSDKLLTAFFPAAAMQQIALFEIKVRPANSSTAEGSQIFNVVERVTSFSITSIDPAFVTQNQTGFQLVVIGTGLTDKSKVLISGKEFTTKTRSLSGATALEVTVTSETTATKGFLAVQVQNPGSGTNAPPIISNLRTLGVSVDVPKPIIMGINPTTVAAGTDTFILTITGDKFLPGAQVTFGGTVLPITFFSGTEIRARVSSALFRTKGEIEVVVENPGGVRADQGIKLNVTDPVYQIQEIAPKQVFQGGPTVLVEIFGDNIPASPTVKLNGAALPTDITVKNVNQDRILIEIKAAKLTTVGELVFQVTNPTDPNAPVAERKLTIVPPVATVSTFAGRGFVGLLDGPLDQARFTRPSRMAQSAVDGSFWIADQFNHAVRRIATNPSDPQVGRVQTIAGNGTRGVNWPNPVTVTAADLAKPPKNNPVRMDNPVGIAIDSDNTVYVTELGNHLIRRIRPQPDGSYIVDVFAGKVEEKTDDKGTTDPSDDTKFFAGTAGFANGPRTSSEANTTIALFNGPDGILLGVDKDNNKVLYVADGFNFRIRRVFLAGPKKDTVDTLAGSLPGGFGGTGDGNGDNARFNAVAGLELAADGTTLNVTDPINEAIRQVNTITADVTTLNQTGSDNADGGPGAGRFAAPTATATTRDGKLLVADSRSNNAIRWLQPDGSILTFAGENFGKGAFKDGGQFEARFNQPRSIFVASDGTIYVVDSGNHMIRKITINAGSSGSRPNPRNRIHTPRRRR